MDALVPILIIVFLVGVVWLAFVFAKKQSEKNWNHYVRLGQAFGITVVKPKIGYFMPALPRLEGTFRNTVLSIYTDRRGSGKHTHYYTVINIRLWANPGFEFRLTKEGFFQKIGKAFGMQDIQVGNEVFDKAFVLKSPDENRARQVFDIMLCNKLAEHEKQIRSAISLNQGIMHYEEMVIVNSDEMINRVNLIVNLSIEIAEKISGGGQRVR